jgi:hypothetical protein
MLDSLICLSRNEIQKGLGTDDNILKCIFLFIWGIISELREKGQMKARLIALYTVG